MLNSFTRRALLPAFAFAVLIGFVGCRAQQPPTAGSSGLSPELARRIAVLVRTRANIPFNYDVTATERHGSTKLPGYDEVTVLVGEPGTSGRPTVFLLSKDEKTLAQLSTYDMSQDPRTITLDTGRPARGGPETAPVHIVVFDDLECPFCARMHAQLFPALIKRYGDQVRIAYKDFPLTQHPWAIHAAVDADCLGSQNDAAYWRYVDYLHAHADEIGGEEKSLTAAKIQLDKLAGDEGRSSRVDEAKLKACVEKQDESPVKAGLSEGEALSVNGVPALFINGQPINGAAPVEFVYRAVDGALLAQGIKPPPAVPLPDLKAAASAQQ